MTAAADRSGDVLIAGGGMIGATLALALAPLGLDITVVEAVPRGEPAQPSFDDRSTALSRSTQRMFEAMGLWPDIAAAATPITRVHVSDRGRFGFSHIDAAEQHVEALGYVVINRVLGEVLQSALADAPGVEQLCPATVERVSVGPDAATVTVTQADGGTQRIDSRLLVAADGARSSVRGMLGIGARQRDYGQHAVIGNLLPERPINGVAYERFTESGPLALLPIADRRAAFVWTVDTAAVADVLALDDEQFLARLQAEFGNRLGAFSRVGTRSAYPLTLSRAERVVAARSVLAGNAANGLHPVAAQGFNLGLRDVAALCDCIADVLAAGGAADGIGAPRTLSRYADWRRRDQRTLLGLTDGLVRLFGSGKAPVRLLRNVGMLAFDLVPGVRTAFARQAMGLGGRLPRLSRGVPLR